MKKYDAIINKYIGIKYVNNGRDPNLGLDCWGLCMSWVKDIYGITLPDTAYNWKKLVVNKERIFDRFDLSTWAFPVKYPKFSDFILFNVYTDTPVHVGIYLGNDRFIQAISACGVCTASFIQYKESVAGIYRLHQHLKESNK